MPSSYVYLSGQVSLKPVVAHRMDRLLSRSATIMGWIGPGSHIANSGEATLDLKRLCFRRYDYRLKFEFSGEGTGLDALRIKHDVQHSQAPLPALLEGKNKITVTTGPYEGTVSSKAPSSVEMRDKGKNLFYKAFHPTLKGGTRTDGLRIEGKGTATFPVATPGAMTRIRMNAFWRARDKRDGYDVSVSFNGGKTYRKVTRLGGPTAGETRYLTIAGIPAHPASPGAVRRSIVQHHDALRSADQPRLPPAARRIPADPGYLYLERGRPRKAHEHVATRPDDVYTISCRAKTVVKSLAVELAK